MAHLHVKPSSVWMLFFLQPQFLSFNRVEMIQVELQKLGILVVFNTQFNSISFI
jgi:hypothetical protein